MRSGFPCGVARRGISPDALSERSSLRWNRTKVAGRFRSRRWLVLGQLRARRSDGRAGILHQLTGGVPAFREELFAALARNLYFGRFVDRVREPESALHAFSARLALKYYVVAGLGFVCGE